jgi:drug/metabolite transporter (DMT)-like permease
MSGPPLRAYLYLAASMALVGSYVGLSKLLVAVLPVFLLAWLRFGIAALAMLHWVRRSPHEPPLSRHDRWLLFWESFLGNFLFSICMLYGVALSSAVAAGVAMAGIPAAVALLSWLFLRERITRAWAGHRLRGLGHRRCWRWRAAAMARLRCRRWASCC